MMSRKIVFASNNRHKLEEVRNILNDKNIEVVSLDEIGFTDEIPETANTLEGNAELKARAIYEKFGIDCFADDTGLEIEELGGKPGVFSARYAGEPSDSAKNIEKVLNELDGKANRNAQFRTVICLIEYGKTLFFEGKIIGEIATMPQGKRGFGYDPIFVPSGKKKSFAELSPDEKNEISHRALAVRLLDNHFDSFPD